jgi:hypothetical protein
MGGVYKDKKSSGCGLCKPHKHGWDPKHKNRYRMEAKIATEEMRIYDCCVSGIYDSCVAVFGCPVCDKDEA